MPGGRHKGHRGAENLPRRLDSIQSLAPEIPTTFSFRQTFHFQSMSNKKNLAAIAILASIFLGGIWISYHLNTDFGLLEVETISIPAGDLQLSGLRYIPPEAHPDTLDRPWSSPMVSAAPRRPSAASPSSSSPISLCSGYSTYPCTR